MLSRRTASGKHADLPAWPNMPTRAGAREGMALGDVLTSPDRMNAVTTNYFSSSAWMANNCDLSAMYSTLLATTGVL
jgi:hypothetical protein